jgi:formiminotetrahydrofolate cyclodeaminase
MAERDCASFDHVSAAYALPKQTDEEQAVRARAIETALVGAIVVPEELIFLVRDVLARFVPISDLIGKAIVSDMGSGAELLRAAATCAWLNVRVNAVYLTDKGKAHATESRVRAVLDELERHYGALRGSVDRLLG